MQSLLHALGLQLRAGPDEGHCAEVLSLSRTVIPNRQGQDWRVDWFSSCWSIVWGRDLSREVHWSLLGIVVGEKGTEAGG